MAPGTDPYAAMTAFNRSALAPARRSRAGGERSARFSAQEIRAQGAGLISAEGLSSTPRALQMFFSEQQNCASRAKPPRPWRRRSPWPAPTQATRTPRPIRRPNPNRRSRRSSKSCFAPRRWRFQRAIKAGAGLVERLVAFWSNHFAVSVAKGQGVRATAGAFEREAIRPHVLGKFSDLLIAVESHPAMIFYLDNQRSIGPGSNAGRSTARGSTKISPAKFSNCIRSASTAAMLSPMSRRWRASSRAGVSRKPAAKPASPARSCSRPIGTSPACIICSAGTIRRPAARKARRRCAISRASRDRAPYRDQARAPFRRRRAAARSRRRAGESFRDSDGDLSVVAAALVTDDRAWSAPPTKISRPERIRDRRDARDGLHAE